MRTSASAWQSIKKELLTEPSRVLRGVDGETRGSRVIENLIVVSSLRRESSKLSTKSDNKGTVPFYMMAFLRLNIQLTLYSARPEILGN